MIKRHLIGFILIGIIVIGFIGVAGLIQYSINQNAKDVCELASELGYDTEMRWMYCYVEGEIVGNKEHLLDVIEILERLEELKK